MAAVYDFFDGLFKAKLDANLSHFLGDNYKSHFKYDMDPMGIANALKLTLLYYILHNDEVKYMKYVEVV